jgi:hypothetical protein
MPIPSRPIPRPTAVETEAQGALNYLLASVQQVHPGATIAEHPDLAIEALCVLVGGALAKNRELERLVNIFISGPESL